MGRLCMVPRLFARVTPRVFKKPNRWTFRVERRFTFAERWGFKANLFNMSDDVQALVVASVADIAATHTAALERLNKEMVALVPSTVKVEVVARRVLGRRLHPRLALHLPADLQEHDESGIVHRKCF
ncbi:hypothetical protein BASA81_004434 [Batrachochytrium salamandrivorans]|nr:hypothetical protein BASA81_004434 [Batrachochytrium salamandrivorans]